VSLFFTFVIQRILFFCWYSRNTTPAFTSTVGSCSSLVRFYERSLIDKIEIEYPVDEEGNPMIDETTRKQKEMYERCWKRLLKYHITVYGGFTFLAFSFPQFAHAIKIAITINKTTQIPPKTPIKIVFRVLTSASAPEVTQTSGHIVGAGVM
jgi:hypothetical protein